MKTLDRKLLRDLYGMRGQAFAIAAVLACGVAIFVMAMTTLVSLRSAKEDYYSAYRFADVFVFLKRAPNQLIERIREIDGVSIADHRVIESLTLDMPGMKEPASGRIISLPRDEKSGLNALYLRSGRWPELGREGEIAVDETFALAHGLQPGGKVKATLRGKLRVFRVVGIALSPEYLIQAEPGALFPDDKRFGIFWIQRRQLEAASDMEGAFNDLTIRLARGAIPNQVIRELDQILEPYGSRGAYTRDDHYSASFIENELKELRTMATIPPGIFLSVSAFLLNISFRRILVMQREQIATLKAFGYTNFEVASHYCKLVGVIVLSGGIGGCVLGTWMGEGNTEFYRRFIHFPYADYQLDPQTYLAAIGLSLSAGALGLLGGLRDTVKLVPAEAMRPEPPARYRAAGFEQSAWYRAFAPPTRMVFRELYRRPLRAFLMSMGVAFACGILIIGNFGKDAISYLVDFQFGLAERDDARVHFVEARSYSAIRELDSINGVIRAEPFRSIPVKMIHGPREERLSVVGMAEGGRLYRLLDENEQVIPVVGDGLILSSVMAELLDVSVGDEIEVHVLEGERRTVQVKVSGLVEEFSGKTSYMNLEALGKILGEGRTVSGAYLSLDPVEEESVFVDLKQRPGVASVSLKAAAMKGFMDSIAENILRMRLFNVSFAITIAIGVIYSGARISFSERGRDLATLRVIGFTQGEVSRMLLGELAIVTLVGIPIGFAIGYGLCVWMTVAMSSEVFRIPFRLNSATYGFAGCVIIFASVLSGWFIRRKVAHLDLVSALKVKE